ncbi:hypothetical protein IJ556_06450 [bacterium]|nr:hypothetical protein [bacterium]
MLNHFIIDFVAFGLPLLYHQRTPDHKSGMITVQKTLITSDYDAFAPNEVGLACPEPNLLDSLRILTYFL